MKERYIAILVDSTPEIDAVCAKYDPVFRLVGPHITLVFPFKSEIDNTEVIKHIDRVSKQYPLKDLELYGISRYGDEYMFLNIKTGFKKLTSLHDILYNGILAEFKNQDIPYIPHVTVGRISNTELLNQAIRHTSSLNIHTSIKSPVISLLEIQDNKDVEIHRSQIWPNQSLHQSP